MVQSILLVEMCNTCLIPKMLQKEVQLLQSQQEA